MTPSTKVFATLSLSAATGQKIGGDSGTALNNAGYLATHKWPYAALKTKKVIQIMDAVGTLLSDPVNLPSVLRMLVAGLVDIRAAVKPDRQEILDPVIDAVGKCLDQFPADEDDEIKAFERYQSWTM